MISHEMRVELFDLFCFVRGLGRCICVEFGLK